jgi:hypothetical protein
MQADNQIKRRIDWNYWIPPFFFLLFFIIEGQAFGTFYTGWLYGLVLILFGIIYSIRYKLYQPILLFGLAGLTLWHYMLAAKYEVSITMLQSLGMDISVNPDVNPFSMLTWIINLVFFLILIPIIGPALEKAYKLEQSAKRIFKTAAQTVTSSKNGFTSRPFFAGNAEYSKAEITGFAQYLAGQVIVYPFFTETGIYLTFSMGKSPVSIKDATEISYLYFENTGNITVIISAPDYKRFRKELTFDQLCESLSSLFKRFLNYYINNQEARIMTELKST